MTGRRRVGRGRVGFVPTVTELVAPSSKNAIAVICGPPIMIKFTLPVMTKLGFTQEQTVTSLEKRMKCGIGICGRFNVGPVFGAPKSRGLRASLSVTLLTVWV